MQLSVVIPVFNVESYLSTCVESVLFLRDIIDYEIILVDDGSTDDSYNICLSYGEAYPDIIKIIQKKNGGLSEARNYGVQAAQGEWIYFLDSDDWIPPDALFKLLLFGIDNNCEMVSGGCYYAFDSYLQYDNRWFKDTKPFTLSRIEAMSALIKQQYLKNFAWGKLYKTDIVKKHPFRKGVYFEDSYWQHLIIDECELVGIIPEPLYYYNQRRNSISGTFSKRNLDLLRGNEERLMFIKEKYPDLVSDMVSFFWKLCYHYLIKAKSTGEKEIISLYSNYNTEIEERYKDLFDTVLRNDLEYRVRHINSVASAYRLFQKVRDQLFVGQWNR